MRSRKLISLLFGLAIILAVVHKAAIERGWYLAYPHIDIFLHLLGGVVLALMAAAIILPVIYTHQLSFEQQFWGIITFTAITAVGWEVFESVFHLTLDAGFGPNTLSDILFGMVGGAVGWCITTSVSDAYDSKSRSITKLFR